MRLLPALTFLAISLCACNNKPPVSNPANAHGSNLDTSLPEPKRTLMSDLTVVTLTTQLPDSCKAAFVRLTGLPKFEMAEPNRRFEATDVVSGHLPRRRLVVGAYNQDRCLIAYEKGGIALSRQIVFFAVSPGQSSEFIGGTEMNQTASFEEIRANLLHREMPVLTLTELYW